MFIEPDKRGTEQRHPANVCRKPGRNILHPGEPLPGRNDEYSGPLARHGGLCPKPSVYVRRLGAEISVRRSLVPSFPTRASSQEVIELIVTRLTELNSMIVSEKTNLGTGFVIGHSFFCPQETEQELGVDWYRSVIRWEIAPLVREYWFDASDKAEELIARLLE